MLNHAVLACDALVVHLPDHDHAYTSLTDMHSLAGNVSDSTEQLSENHTEQHNEHAHVTCYIAFFYGIDLLNFRDGAIAAANTDISPISHRPPVPPPNS